MEYKPEAVIVPNGNQQPGAGGNFIDKVHDLGQSGLEAARDILRPWKLKHLTAVALSTVSMLGVPEIANAAASHRGHTKPSGEAVHVIETTANLSDHLTPQPDLQFSTSHPTEADVINVNQNVRYQQMKGFGAAMTDSSAYLINSLAYQKKVQLMTALFSKTDGIGMSYIRLPFGSSDFTVGQPYSYDDMPAGQSDPTLAHFSIAHDRKYIIPTLKMMREINPDTRIVSTVWSPPGWMKQNDSMTIADGNDNLLSADWVEPALVSYFTKALLAYKAAGIAINAITPQNEPGVVNSYPTDNFSELQEQAMIPLLAQAINNAGLDTAVYGNDSSFNQFGFADALASAFANTNVMKGIAWHAYFGNIAVMSQMHSEYPNLNQLVTEISPELREQTTISSLISAVRNYASGYLLWNFALNSEGGPVLPPNHGCPGCTPVVTINNGSFKFGPKFFQEGQASSEVEPGAWRIESNNFVNYGVNPENGYPTVSSGVDDVAFIDPSGKKVLVVDNTGPTQEVGVRDGDKSFSANIPSGAALTFSWH